MSKSKPILVGVLYRASDEPDFIEHLNNPWKESNISNTQECYLIDDFNVNLLSGNKMISEKQYSDSYSQAPPIFKNHIDLCFSHSLYQLPREPTRTTEHTKTLIDHILTNSPEKIIQSGVIEMGLSDHEPIYCSIKTPLLKLNKHYEISFRSIKNYSDETFVDKLRSIKFPDYSNHSCVNHAYQDFVTKFLSAVGSVSPTRTLRVKFNTKPWFGIDILNALRNRDKHYKKFKQLGRETDKYKFKYARLSLKKLLIIRKNFTLRKKMQKITIPKNSGEHWNI